MATSVRTRALCVVNPKAGSRHAGTGDLGEVVRILEAAGIHLDVRECALPEPTAEQLARGAVESGYEAVIAAGGDGTVQAVARELLGSGVVLGILPFGSFMNIAKGLGVPLDAAGAARVIAARNVSHADVGEVHGRVFFETAGIGLDAELFGAARAAERGSWRRAMRWIWRWARQGSHRLRVTTPEAERTVRAYQALVVNSPYYHWSFPVAPAGDMRDGLLEVLLFPRMGRRALVRSLLRLWREGRHQEPPVVIRAREATVSSDARLPVHADGRLVGTLPATFRVRPGALAVYAPEGGAAQPR
ncbi:MAG: diacylglycerol/lipid kinase family protein [Candidatus Limnocylindria bacterium]